MTELNGCIVVIVDEDDRLLATGTDFSTKLYRPYVTVSESQMIRAEQAAWDTYFQDHFFSNNSHPMLRAIRHAENHISMISNYLKEHEGLKIRLSWIGHGEGRDMNIFATSSSPYDCALALDDQRVGKMLIETNQMLSTVLVCNELIRDFEPDEVAEGKLSRPAYRNHPCTTWVGASYLNFTWTLDLARCLGDEFSVRYDGKEHGSSARTRWIIENVLFADRFVVTNMGGWNRTPFANCAANESLCLDFRWLTDVHDAYRHYLRARWSMAKREPTWTNRNPPEWKYQ